MKTRRYRMLPWAFIMLGLVDFIYGILRPDRISLVMGAVMVGIAVWIVLKRQPGAS